MLFRPARSSNDQPGLPSGQGILNLCIGTPFSTEPERFQHK